MDRVKLLHAYWNNNNNGELNIGRKPKNIFLIKLQKKISYDMGHVTLYIWSEEKLDNMSLLRRNHEWGKHKKGSNTHILVFWFYLVEIRFSFYIIESFKVMIEAIRQYVWSWSLNVTMNLEFYSELWSSIHSCRAKCVMIFVFWTLRPCDLHVIAWHSNQAMMHFKYWNCLILYFCKLFL